MLRYAITDISRSGLAATARHASLRAHLRRWAAEGIDFVQLREKTLAAGELFDLAHTLADDLRDTGSRTRLLINGRADIAAASGAHGVHLTAAAGELTPGQVRGVFAAAGRALPLVSVSCHTPEQAAGAQHAAADLLLFGPVFEKVVRNGRTLNGSGLALLTQAVRAAGSTPVLALGGVTEANAGMCLETGAAGIAAIRLFAQPASHHPLTEEVVSDKW